MGEIKDEIASVFKRLHQNETYIQAEGSFTSKRGSGILNYLLWVFIRIPITTEKKAFTLTIQPNGQNSIWNRTFGSNQFITKIYNNENTIKESLGGLTFEFDLIATENRLIYKFRKLFLFNIPIPYFISVQPNAICDMISETEWEFNVETKSPLGGTIIHYWGNAKIKPTTRFISP